MKTFLLEQIGQILILVLWKSISSLLKIVAVKKRAPISSKILFKCNDLTIANFVKNKAVMLGLDID